MMRTMETKNGQLERVMRTLRECRGVIVARLLSEEEKQTVLDLEKNVEEKVVFGMSKSLNEGVRVTLQMEYTVAMVIQSSIFPYPHHPHVSMRCGDQVVGELITDEGALEELRKNRYNFFLWENFVVYVKRLPKDPEGRRKLRIVYPSREAIQLKDLSSVKSSVFGTPSTEGDALIKRMLDIHSEEGAVGTCLVGFTLVR
jgi:hypothetical protein